jgi:hypothetical protein
MAEHFPTYGRHSMAKQLGRALHGLVINVKLVRRLMGALGLLQHRRWQNVEHCGEEDALGWLQQLGAMG